MNEEKLLKILQRVMPDLRKLGEFEHADFYSKKNNMFAEIKTRSRHWDTLGIEKVKYDHIINLPKIRFIVATPVGIYSWNLRKLPEPTWISVVGPTSTYFKHLQHIDTVTKKLGYLHIDDAKNLSHLLYK